MEIQRKINEHSYWDMPVKPVLPKKYIYEMVVIVEK